jgi:hypothetical protein
MEEKRQAWWIARWRVAAAALGMFAAFISLGYGFKLGWIGLAKDPKYKTIWDWLDLLIVPAVIAVGVFVLEWKQRAREQRAQAREQRRQQREMKAQRVRELESEDQRAQDAALQSYLDQMSQLLIDKNLHKKANRYDNTRVTARARTLAVLSQLDGERKRTVLLFLRESRLINRYWHVRNFRIVYARIVGLRECRSEKRQAARGETDQRRPR